MVSVDPQTRGPLAKLVDFGLAKSFTSSGQSGLTAPGEGMGTLAYMPPEQLDNALMADQRSDIYSLGASLYHMLAGKRPFDEKTTRSFILKILNQMPPPIKVLNPAVPAEVQQIVEKAMAKSPDDRYQTPKDFEGDLISIFQKLAAKYAAQQRG
jgi:serine/threonine protein kinase